jgi:hypothetical protein
MTNREKDDSISGQLAPLVVRQPLLTPFLTPFLTP